MRRKFVSVVIVALSWSSTTLSQDTREISGFSRELSSLKFQRTDELKQYLNERTISLPNSNLGEIRRFRQFSEAGLLSEFGKLFDDGKKIVVPGPSINSDPRLQKQMKDLNITAKIAVLNIALNCNDFDQPSISTDKTCDNPNITTRSECFKVDDTAFPEVVRLEISLEGYKDSICTGTLVGKNWILTAAHCIAGSASTENFYQSHESHSSQGIDGPAFPLGGAPNSIVVSAQDKSAFQVKATGAALHPDFTGNQYDDTNFDLALLRIPTSPPGQSARIAARAETVATIAGYGFNNVGKPLGTFLVGLIPNMIDQGGRLWFTRQPSASGFCPGDSGGPIFAGRARGCAADSLAKEYRPRRVQAVVSNLKRSPGTTQADQCLSSQRMNLQTVISDSAKTWICKTSSNEINGCTGEN